MERWNMEVGLAIALAAVGGITLVGTLASGQTALPPAPPELILANGVALQPLLPELVPASGTFWSLQNSYPPSPFDPFPDLPVYPLPGGGFVFVNLKPLGERTDSGQKVIARLRPCVAQRLCGFEIVIPECGRGIDDDHAAEVLGGGRG